MEASAFSPVHISWIDAIARIAAAFVLAFALGLERFARDKPIDFRPFVIISVASCVLALAVLELPYTVPPDLYSIDPAKVLSGIMTGIGFIGAGALFREQHVVRGAGSAASIWAAGAIGIACGFGFLWMAGLLTVALIAILLLSRPFTQEYTIRIDDDQDEDDRAKGRDRGES